MKDVLKIFSDRKRILQEFSKNHAYCLWILFKLTDSIVSLDLEELRVGTEKFEAMKELLGILEKYRNKLRLNDPLDLDPNMAGELTGEIIIRYNNVPFFIILSEFCSLDGKCALILPRIFSPGRTQPTPMDEIRPRKDLTV